MSDDPITDISHEIRDQINQINRTWLKGDTADLARYFHPDIVIQPPGDSPRVYGVEDCIASYQAFVEQAHVRSFEPHDAEIDVFGNTVVATYRFRVVYEMGGVSYDETGGELLVFLRCDDGWRVAWRTLRT